MLAPVGEVMSAGPGTASPAGVRLGSLMIDSEATSAVLTLVFCLGAGMFYVLLYRSRIVPRWIALWGLVAIPFYVAADVLAVYAVIGVDSTAQNLLFAPIFVQEMVLAAWMIARGFRPAAPSTGREAASSPTQPRSFLLGAPRGPRVARARRIVTPPCGAAFGAKRRHAGPAPGPSAAISSYTLIAIFCDQRRPGPRPRATRTRRNLPVAISRSCSSAVR